MENEETMLNGVPVLGAHVVWRILEEVNLGPPLHQPVLHLCDRLLPGTQPPANKYQINDHICSRLHIGTES